MNRNVESHFARLPESDIARSRFDRSSGHKTSFNSGQLIPFFLDEVYPGDTFEVTTSIVARLQTLLTPIMDNVYLDTYYFFVPNRLLWNHWKEFMGENTESAWIPTTQYRVPFISFPVHDPDDDHPNGYYGWDTGTIADYLGVPPTDFEQITEGIDTRWFPSALPFRAYAMICDQWFRDQNLTDPLYIPVGDEIVEGSNGSDYITDVAKGGKPFLVAKYHDYFTSCLPAPQKHEPVSIFPNYDPVSGIPVKTGEIHQNSYSGTGLFWRSNVDSGSYEGSVHSLAAKQTSSPDTFTTVAREAIGTMADYPWFVEPANLWAEGLPNVTINELRLAFQLQKFYEKQARGGSRYREIIHEMFGVVSPDARQQIPEYLGGHRFPLSIHQIANQSQGESDFLGDLGAMSNTSDVHEDFVKSFTEHGFILGVCCVRYDHTYSQGLEKFWSRRDYLDYYWPVFANIGEQPVYAAELYLNSSDSLNRRVFGYQEAWADLRYKPSRVSGEMRPSVPNTLASWHLADDYSEAPTLSDEWIREDKTNVDRVLAVTSQLANQVFCDFYVKCFATRPMPMYSIPGLVDHH